MFTLVITTNKSGDKIASLFNTSISYGDLKASAEAKVASPSFSTLLTAALEGKTTGKGASATSEDIAQAILEESTSLVNTNDNSGSSAPSWATRDGSILTHNTKGTKYLQGANLGSFILVENTEKVAKKTRGSRNGVTLAKKVARTLLPTSSWRMVNLDNATSVLTGKSLGAIKRQMNLIQFVPLKGWEALQSNPV